MALGFGAMSIRRRADPRRFEARARAISQSQWLADWHAACLKGRHGTDVSYFRTAEGMLRYLW